MLSHHIIQTIPFFSGLHPSTLQTIAQISNMVYYQRGTVIYDNQKDEQALIYIIKGWVKLHRVSIEGEEIITDILSEQHHFNAHLLFSVKNDAFFAKSLSPLQVITTPISVIKQCLYQDNQLTINLLKESTRKQQEMTYEIEHLSIQNAAQRIGCFLLRLCDLGETKACTLQLPYDKTLLATRLGMRPETFSRALRKLIKLCKIRVFGNKIYIDTLGRLVDYVCQHCSLTFPCKESIKKSYYSAAL